MYNTVCIRWNNVPTQTIFSIIARLLEKTNSYSENSRRFIPSIYKKGYKKDEEHRVLRLISCYSFIRASSGKIMHSS